MFKKYSFFASHVVLIFIFSSACFLCFYKVNKNFRVFLYNKLKDTRIFIKKDLPRSKYIIKEKIPKVKDFIVKSVEEVHYVYDETMGFVSSENSRILTQGKGISTSIK